MSTGSIVDTNKVFEIVNADGEQKAVTIRQLTIKEKDKLYNENEELIKSRKRKEFLAMSEVLNPKDKMRFLVESAGSNKATFEEVLAESQTVGGISKVLKLCAKCASEIVDWEKMLVDDVLVDHALGCYYWALGIDIPETKTEEKSVENTEEGKTGDFFPVGQPSVTS